MYRDLPEAWIERAGSADDAVLLETRRFDPENYRSYLFLHPLAVVRASSPAEVPPLLRELEEHSRRGHFAAGYLAYEAGGEEPLQRSAPGYPLAWFGIYERPEIFDHRSGTPDPASAPAPPGAAVDPRSLRLTIGFDDYRSAVERIKEHIREGDTYQINFTTAFEFPAAAGAVPLYASLRQRQRVAYGALVRAGGELSILSFSPELFFRLDGARIVTRPMKGTAGRGRTIEEDEEQRAWLRQDPKNRSENIMIVDLIRNDLGRICTPGSVKTTELCSVETFETLFQMTSTVEGELRPGTPISEIFRCLFPSGSVTGAPKIRSMQIINDLERRPRGVYTGAIGFISPGGDAVFNVAIRTIVLHAGTGTMGTGSGIVIDSDPGEEFAECRLKGRFLTEGGGEFELIETMRWNGGFPLLRYHLARLRSSAAYFGFAFSEEEFDRNLRDATAALDPGQGACRVRLLLSRAGTVRVETAPLASGRAEPSTIVVAPVPVDSSDPFLYHKTTRRALYDEAFTLARAEGYADALFLNERDEVTECTRNTIFILRNGFLVTPPVPCGLLRGVYRTYLADNAGIREEKLSLADLAAAEAVYIGNAVRGLRAVTFVPGARLRHPPPPVAAADGGGAPR